MSEKNLKKERKQPRAKRICFLAGDGESIYDERELEFDFYSGFDISQKQKSIRSFHSVIKEKYPDKKILEASRKSLESLGRKCSAFNLTLDGYTLECVFQSSKVFVNIKTKEEKNFKHLIGVEPQEAKKAINEFFEKNVITKELKDKDKKENEKNEKNFILSHFDYFYEKYPLEPKSAFYDFIYIQALEQFEGKDELLKYDIFTDIEFNPKRQFNCQARTCAIYVGLKRQGKLDYFLENFENFKEIYNFKNFIPLEPKKAKISKKSKEPKDEPALF